MRLKEKQEQALNRFLYDMYEEIQPLCERASKLTEDERADFSDDERRSAYNYACLTFSGNLLLYQGEEAEWLKQLIDYITARYDDGLREVIAFDRVYNVEYEFNESD